MPCHWCGDEHRSDQLCQRAQRGMTRRSFCFLFGAGVAGAMLPNVVQPWTKEYVAKLFDTPVDALDDPPTFMGRPIEFVNFNGVPPAEALQRLTDKISANYRTSIPLSEWIAPSYRRG